MARAVNTVISVLLILVIVVVAGALVYTIAYRVVGSASTDTPKLGIVKIEAAYMVKVGSLSELVLYLRSIDARGYVDIIYVKELSGRLVSKGYPFNTVYLEPGSTVVAVFVLSPPVEPDRQYIISLGVRGVGVVSAGSAILDYRVPGRHYTIYLVKVPGACSPYVGDTEELRSALSFLGEVVVVDDQDRLGEVVEGAGEYTIIVNLHGEAVPAPTWVWQGAGWRNDSHWYGEPPRWLDWLSAVRSAIAERGAIWVNVGGWPFYYITNETCSNGRGIYQVAVHECGNDTWERWVGYHGYHYMVNGSFTCLPPSSVAAYCYLSQSGTFFNATDMLALIAPIVYELSGYQPPLQHTHDVRRDRPCSFRVPVDVTPLHEARIGDTAWYGVYALRLGQGYIVHVGYGTTVTEEERAALILAGILSALGGHEA